MHFKATPSKNTQSGLGVEYLGSAAHSDPLSGYTTTE